MVTQQRYRIWSESPPQQTPVMKPSLLIVECEPLTSSPPSPCRTRARTASYDGDSLIDMGVEAQEPCSFHVASLPFSYLNPPVPQS